MSETTEIKEHPLLLSGEMVRAYNAGRKWQTRRLVTARNSEWVKLEGKQLPELLRSRKTKIGRFVNHTGLDYGKNVLCTSRIRPGARLWFRETWKLSPEEGHSSPGNGLPVCPTLHFRADGDHVQVDGWETPWRPSIFMPRKFARFTPKVTAVRVERVQDISEADAVAEGTGGANFFQSPMESIHADKRWQTWADNPWVWVYEFEKCEGGMTA